MVIGKTIKFNNMKKTILLSMVALAASVNLQAQEEKGLGQKEVQE